VAAYIESASSLLGQFANIALRNKVSLLLSDDDVEKAVADACLTVMSEARDGILSDYPVENLRNLLTTEFDSKSAPLLEHLQRTVRLRGIDLGGSMPSVQISDSQIGNLVLGSSVNESQLKASIKEIVKQGGIEPEVVRAIEKIVQVIAQINDAHKAERAELYDLLKGLLQQINLPQKDRSPSTIRVVWERFVQVSQVSAEVVKAIESVLPLISGLLGS
jgi:hypothetical protein